MKRIALLLVLIIIAGIMRTSYIQGVENATCLEPFLALPFSAGTDFEITQGWKYSDDEIEVHPTITNHQGIDFQVERGTPVYAAADGYAISSYQLSYVGMWQGRAVGYSFGNFVQIWHPDQKIFSLYAHLDKITENIPYFEPTQKEYPEGVGWAPEIVARPFSETINQAKFVRKGELIGYAGDTGLSWGYEERPGFRPDPTENPTWDPAGVHVHFELFRRDAEGKKVDMMDPFGIYGDRMDYYDMFAFGRIETGDCELWVLDRNGQPLYTK